MPGPRGTYSEDLRRLSWKLHHMEGDRLEDAMATGAHFIQR
jgi:hypothetical protein